MDFPLQTIHFWVSPFLGNLYILAVVNPFVLNQGHAASGFRSFKQIFQHLLNLEVLITDQQKHQGPSTVTVVGRLIFSPPPREDRFFPLDCGKSNAATIPKKGLGILVPYWNNVFQNWIVVSCCNGLIFGKEYGLPQICWLLVTCPRRKLWDCCKQHPNIV